jgi:predicted AAA+ superfamily ATPase
MWLKIVHVVVDFQPPNCQNEAMFPRHVAPLIKTAMTDTPVVLLQGPRQSGKSTLAKNLIAEVVEGRYLALDDATVLAAAVADAAGFVRGLTGPTVLDEIQRAPGLMVAIKAEIDRDRRPGRFLLTGSANVLMLPKVAESLAGRMELHALLPLSQGELEGRNEGFIDALFATDALPAPKGTLDRPALVARILAGGYPEAVARQNAGRRRAWFDAYVTTILQRDVRDIAQVEHLTQVPRLLALLAARMATLLNHAEISRSLELPQTTLKRYLALLETVFLVRELPAWSGNLSKRLVKAPKLLVDDSGLAAALLGLDAERLAAEPGYLGALLENFVAMELVKQVPWSSTRPQAFHYRSHAGQEIDLLLEDARGRLVGIEIKARQTLDGRDFRALRDLATDLPERFHRGVVLYTGSESVSFGDRLQALPVEALWRL